ncbi:hypothetical protein BDN67DRAFT_911446, partial [Paxillus ammoniavirescens]
NQWRHWSTEVIPLLLPLFRTHLHETDNLQSPWTTSPGRVFFDSKGPPSLTYIWVSIAHIFICCCSCSTAACQFIMMGLFPCAPVMPSLVVDLRVLQFVKTLFMWQTPNMNLCRQGLFHSVWNHNGIMLIVMVFRTI